MINFQEHIITKQVKESNKEAFKEMYLSFYRAVHYFISQYIEDPDTVKDLSQEAFYLLWKNRERLNETLGYKSYLLSIAKNLILNYNRSGKYNRNYVNSVIDKHNRTKNHNEDLLFNRIENNNLLKIVYSEIDKLPQKQKDVVILSKMGHLTNKEIAAKLGISIKTVEYRIACALRKIRKIIEC